MGHLLSEVIQQLSNDLHTRHGVTVMELAFKTTNAQSMALPEAFTAQSVQELTGSLQRENVSSTPAQQQKMEPPHYPNQSSYLMFVRDFYAVEDVVNSIIADVSEAVTVSVSTAAEISLPPVPPLEMQLPISSATYVVVLIPDLAIFSDSHQEEMHTILADQEPEFFLVEVEEIIAETVPESCHPNLDDQLYTVEKPSFSP